jgi:hypothetical protein
MSFFYCIATLLEFAGVHYFTKASIGVCLSRALSLLHVRRKARIFGSEVKKYEKKGENNWAWNYLIFTLRQVSF